MGNLTDALKTKTSSTTSTMTQEKKKEVPKGAKITGQTIRTETEQIENGFLISKNYDITYEEGAGDNKRTGYCYYTKKWFSKVDPLTITLNDKALADAFDDSDKM